MSPSRPSPTRGPKIRPPVPPPPRLREGHRARDRRPRDTRQARHRDHEYLNDNVFVAGLQTTTIIERRPNGPALRAASIDWGMRDVRASPTASTRSPSRPHRRQTASGAQRLPIAHLVVHAARGRHEEGYFETDEHDRRQRDDPELLYDDLGDVLEQLDEGELESDADDVLTDFIYSDCRSSSSEIVLDDKTTMSGYRLLRRHSVLSDADRRAGLADLDARPVPDVGQPAGRHHGVRRRRRRCCATATAARGLRQPVGDPPRRDASATAEVAVTELTYDAWGSYDRIVYPGRRNGGVRYAVQYVCDSDGPREHRPGHGVRPRRQAADDRRPAVATPWPTLDSCPGHHLGGGLPRRGGLHGARDVARHDLDRLVRRTGCDEPHRRERQRHRYTYDALARLASMSNPVQSDPQPLVTFEYFLERSRRPHAVAHHYDAFHPTTRSTRRSSPTASAGSLAEARRTRRRCPGRRDRRSASSAGRRLRRLRATGRRLQPDARHQPLGTFETATSRCRDEDGHRVQPARPGLPNRPVPGDRVTATSPTSTARSSSAAIGRSVQ